MDTEIKFFVPPAFHKKDLDFEKFSSIFGKNVSYASKGRFAISHILDSFDLKNNTVLLSAYMCETVRDTLQKKGYKIEYYDIDAEDLNSSFESIKVKIDETNAAAVVVPSLYGNPADLEKIQALCREKKVLMIDDAAQSFGAKLGGRYVGTFGDGGLLAFSPGKATAGHMGALYWTSGTENFKRTHHKLLHKIVWKDFYINRLGAYKNKKIAGKIVNKLASFLLMKCDISNDDIEKFERPILGGILNEAMSGGFDFRKNEYKKFCDEFSDNDVFRIVKEQRGYASPHKIVLIFFDSKKADGFKTFLNGRHIAFFSGYDLSDFTDFTGCNKVKDCIVELPIENDEEHIKYIHNSVKTFISK